LAVVRDFNFSTPAVFSTIVSSIKIIFFVPEKIVSRITVGDEVIVDCDSCKNSYKAKITFISPSAEFKNVVLPVPRSSDTRTITGSICLGFS